MQCFGFFFGNKLKFLSIQIEYQFGLIIMHAAIMNKRYFLVSIEDAVLVLDEFGNRLCNGVVVPIHTANEKPTIRCNIHL